MLSSAPPAQCDGARRFSSIFAIAPKIRVHVSLNSYLWIDISCALGNSDDSHDGAVPNFFLKLILTSAILGISVLRRTGCIVDANFGSDAPLHQFVTRVNSILVSSIFRRFKMILDLKDTSKHLRNTSNTLRHKLKVKHCKMHTFMLKRNPTPWHNTSYINGQLCNN